MCQCHSEAAHKGSCTNPHPCPACLARMEKKNVHPGVGQDGEEKMSALWVPCYLCALWMPNREDSTGGAEDYGICPRKQWPHNRTQGIEGCVDGVMAGD